ncbi:MAG: four helix bundle protein [Bacteroidales bacterium]|nr:four helix bundle protein [Bacteroidales bacterium]MCF8403536.1 four helix bundle protein [Bacteroidales bacterium]
MHNYKKLIVWQRAVNLAVSIYDLTRSFPESERYGMINQCQRSACSISNNIAEGSRKSSEKEFNRYLEISDGSSAELNTQLIIAQRIGYISSEVLEKYENEIEEIQKMINKLKNRLSS